MIPCNIPSLPSNVMPSGGVSGFPFLSNTAIEWPPYVVNHVVLGVDSCTEGAPFHTAAGKTGRDGRQRLAVGGELARVALPQRILPLPSNREVVADPEVALAVEHGLAARPIPATVELKGQDPGAGCPVEVRHEWNRAHVWRSRLAVEHDRWDRVELVEQSKQSPRLVPGIAGNRLCCAQRVIRGITLWRGGRRVKLG